MAKESVKYLGVGPSGEFETAQLGVTVKSAGPCVVWREDQEPPKIVKTQPKYIVVRIPKSRDYGKG